MEINTFDFKIYHVDRFDHVLSEEEYMIEPLISYADTLQPDADYEAVMEYEMIEKKLLTFLLDIFTDSISVKQLKLKIRMDQAFSKKELSILNDWEKEVLNNLKNNDQFGEITVSDEENLQSIIKLALKEKIHLRVEFNQSFFASGYDLQLYFQNIDKKKLLSYTSKHGLYILSEWYETLWNAIS